MQKYKDTRAAALPLTAPARAVSSHRRANPPPHARQRNQTNTSHVETYLLPPPSPRAGQAAERLQAPAQPLPLPGPAAHHVRRWASTGVALALLPSPSLPQARGERGRQGRKAAAVPPPPPSRSSGQRRTPHPSPRRGCAGAAALRGSSLV